MRQRTEKDKKTEKQTREHTKVGNKTMKRKEKSRTEKERTVKITIGKKQKNGEEHLNHRREKIRNEKKRT